MPSILPSSLLILLSSILVISLANAAYIQSPSTTLLPPALSLSHPQNLTNSNPYHCTRSPEFLTPQFDASDCSKAIDHFAKIEEKAHGHPQYEFLAPDAGQDHHSLRPQKTPRRYVVGSCVMEIAMMADPMLDDIEGRDVRPGAYTTTDVASYYNLWKQGLRLADVCLGNFGLPGFIVAGEDLSIGVFLWATGSTLDKRLAEATPDETATA